MTSNKLVSIILPAYNAEDFIEEAINSILTQTYKNFELIIINDGSNDRTDKIIKSINDPRIIYISRQNKGLAKTLNEAILIAKGDYIARMDADDVSISYRIEKQVRFMDRNPRYGMISGGMEVIDEKGNHVRYIAPYIGKNIIPWLLNNLFNPLSHPCAMMRASIVREIGGYNEFIEKYFEDQFLWCRISERALIYNMPIILLKYRIVKGAITSGFDNEDSKYVKFITQKSSDGVFTEEDKKKLWKIVEELKNDYTEEVFLRRTRIRFYDRILDFLYQISGNYAIAFFSYLKFIYLNIKKSLC